MNEPVSPKKVTPARLGSNSFPVIGIGASVGGLEALEQVKPDGNFKLQIFATDLDLDAIGFMKTVQ